MDNHSEWWKKRFRKPKSSSKHGGRDEKSMQELDCLLVFEQRQNEVEIILSQKKTVPVPTGKLICFCPGAVHCSHSYSKLCRE